MRDDLIYTGDEDGYLYCVYPHTRDGKDVTPAEAKEFILEMIKSDYDDSYEADMVDYKGLTAWMTNPDREDESIRWDGRDVDIEYVYEFRVD